MSNQPPINTLDSEYLDERLVALNDEMQSLVLLRNTPFLPFVYQESWCNFTNRALNFFDGVAQKCCDIQARAMTRRLRESHSSSQLQNKSLYLANALFYAES